MTVKMTLPQPALQKDEIEIDGTLSMRGSRSLNYYFNVQFIRIVQN